MCWTWYVCLNAYTAYYSLYYMNNQTAPSDDMMLLHMTENKVKVISFLKVAFNNKVSASQG